MDAGPSFAVGTLEVLSQDFWYWKIDLCRFDFRRSFFFFETKELVVLDETKNIRYPAYKSNGKFCYHNTS